MGLSLKPSEIRKMSREEKLRKLEELRMELIRLSLQAEMGTLDAPGKLRTTRKNIARILTILREEELKARAK